MAEVASRRAVDGDVFVHMFLLYTSVRVPRIELGSQPWEGRVLPLNHTRLRT